MIKYLAILFLIWVNVYAKEGASSGMEREQTSQTLKISIGSYTFKARLVDNETTKTLIRMLPLTLEMNDLNGNEKYFHFSTHLPTNVSHPKMIYLGDLMLWKSNSLVLFYQTFSSSYDYTKIGYIEDTTNLVDALGTGNILVKFERE